MKICSYNLFNSKYLNIFEITIFLEKNNKEIEFEYQKLMLKKFKECKMF